MRAANNPAASRPKGKKKKASRKTYWLVKNTITQNFFGTW
ncbi:hypothetical protein YPPY66_0795 [Yersinia pestis PY-66]|uniref:Uncharacterized protein n=3 Tax=Yersinia pseudotuberculosis complex TaxID=1649845 RepID=A0A0U1R334_YERP3|nr:hypothetical protein YpsIP31758_3410 [Yersinia pseudotuberculosis IP 31758]ABX86361.1 hypothetical protein YpAngola_A2941 [Yersinia pestis Angola]ADW00468.1 hypothetical protein YPC_4039 [Yersinia pestis biovar Medievalis str. Harbin 35]EDR32915.1 hypothetical protein YPIP275_2562 [Yersinia pestis biovar Orientalis str. IP275]EDR44475.1 hypothetical protein YpE1979001_3065 [Yersinia pestis biovar Antiqua str. E1979001]EDR51325.1 hypothetical protein YpB42003004_4271 [Yersinia pestis biovar 